MQGISEKYSNITSIIEHINSLQSLLLTIKTSKVKREEINTLIQQTRYETDILLGIIDSLMSIKEDQLRVLKKTQPDVFESYLMSQRDMFQGVSLVYDDMQAGMQYEGFDKGRKTTLGQILIHFLKRSSNKHFKKIKYDGEEFRLVYNALIKWRNDKKVRSKTPTHLKAWRGGNITIEDINKRIRGAYNMKR